MASLSPWTRSPHRRWPLPLVLLACTLLGACGGGGGDSPAATLTGTLRFQEAASPTARAPAPVTAFEAGAAVACIRPGHDTEALAALADLGGRVREANPGGACVLAFDLDGALGTDAQRAATMERIRALDAHPAWLYVEPNHRRSIRRRPNDTRYDEQWHYPLIGLESAWDITVGSDDIIVAVLDTGEGNHPDMAGRLTTGYDFISDASASGDGDGRDSDPTDPGDGGGGQPSSFHGTHVAGTIGASSDNGEGVAGVTWRSRIMHLRVLGEGGGTDADLIAAIRYAAGLPNASGQVPAQRAHVINMSLGGPGFSQGLQDACTAARNAGVVIFAASGNSGDATLEYPAAFDGVVSVGAVDRTGSHASYSTANRAVDLAAPGGDTTRRRADGVLSTLLDDSRGSATPTLDFYDGTSMACPHAAGVAALVLAVAPSLTPAQVEAILFETATDKGASGRDDRYGHGLVDAHAAVLRARDGVTGPLLALGVSQATFTEDGQQQVVTLRNAGTERLEVSGAVARTDSGGSWLAAALEGTGDASRNVDALRVTVDARGVPDGRHAGAVTVASNGGERVLAVVLRLGSGVLIHVELVDWDTGALVAETQVAAGETAFAFPMPPAGRYAVVAGSQRDDQGILCGPGTWCGSSDAQGPIVVGGGATPGAIEIVLTQDAPSAAPAR